MNLNKSFHFSELILLLFCGEGEGSICKNILCPTNPQGCDCIKIENMRKFFVSWKETVLSTAKVFRSLHSHQLPEIGPIDISGVFSPNNNNSVSFSPKTASFLGFLAWHDYRLENIKKAYSLYPNNHRLKMIQEAQTKDHCCGDFPSFVIYSCLVIVSSLVFLW